MNFWWPSVDTLDEAKTASKGGGVAFGFIALGYFLAATFPLVGWNNPTQPEAQAEPALYLTINLLIAGIAGYLAWRAYKRPTLLLCGIGLSWVLIEFFGKVNADLVPDFRTD